MGNKSVEERRIAAARRYIELMRQSNPSKYVIENLDAQELEIDRREEELKNSNEQQYPVAG